MANEKLQVAFHDGPLVDESYRLIQRSISKAFRDRVTASRLTRRQVAELADKPYPYVSLMCAQKSETVLKIGLQRAIDIAHAIGLDTEIQAEIRHVDGRPLHLTSIYRRSDFKDAQLMMRTFRVGCGDALRKYLAGRNELIQDFAARYDINPATVSTMLRSVPMRTAAAQRVLELLEAELLQVELHLEITPLKKPDPLGVGLLSVKEAARIAAKR